MLSRCTLPQYFANAQRSFEAICTTSRIHPLPTQALHNSALHACRVRNKRVKPVSGRAFSTTGLACSRVSSKPKTLFSSDESAWDHVFSEDNFYPASSHSSRPVNSSSQQRPQQAMTARESNAFNEMFEMIFDAVAAQDSAPTPSELPAGVGRGGIDDLIGKLRRYPKRLNRFQESNEALDRQREMVSRLTTDQELLEWAADAVFGESERYEKAARKAIDHATQTGVHGELPMLQPPTYPHMVSLLMCTFREKFNDPHLALSMFEHARHLSIASYVFGCSSQAYHELIVTRWKCFQDLTGVHEALEEMKLNGVKVDPRTAQVVEKIRREVGDMHLWVEESELGSGEIWNILARIEALAAPVASPEAPERLVKVKDKRWDVWKSEPLDDEEGDDWGFDQWNKQGSQGSKPSKAM